MDTANFLPLSPYNMITRTFEEIQGTEREVQAENDNWTSYRLSLKDDNMGFSFHETHIYPGTKTHIHYQNHLETVYCIEGEGEVETIADGKIHPIRPGTIYILDKNDEHYLRAKKKMRLMCVFNPPLTGKEMHDENGVYPADE